MKASPIEVEAPLAKVLQVRRSFPNASAMANVPKDNGPTAKKWRPRDIWVFRIIVAGTILTIGGGALLAFLVIGLPVLFIGGGLLIFFSPVLIFIATITSPIWIPVGGLILATPPILAGLSVAAATCLFFAYWAYNFFRSYKKPSLVDMQDGAFDVDSAVRQRSVD
ncbi:hypothetical protein KFL_000220130 [Klebsormidium nitens]|uniref:Oleosin n=1 Tax=Klebsormidium nitens TaxID=105231 RepID=A0A1Y1HMP9_KLENI|nr:hypothetical protein KFL_000220130 [Klebsormidium nitens]|eukprot:GAQ78982.1 hypothetical protein KFL_000220130 [Klebsormidium nitens]